MEVFRAEIRNSCFIIPCRRLMIQISCPKVLSSRRFLRKCFQKCTKRMVKTIISSLIPTKGSKWGLPIVARTWKRLSITSVTPEAVKKLVSAWNSPRRVPSTWSNLNTSRAALISITRINRRVKITGTPRRITWCPILIMQRRFIGMRWLLSKLRGHPRIAMEKWAPKEAVNRAQRTSIRLIIRVLARIFATIEPSRWTHQACRWALSPLLRRSTSLTWINDLKPSRWFAWPIQIILRFIKRIT